MSDKRQHININADLIRRYLAGELDDKTMHALERQALDDPFLAEALEGYAAHEPDQSAHLADLQGRLEQRVPARTKVRSLYYRWAAAAAVFLLLGLSAVWIWQQQLPARKDIAKVETARYDTVRSQQQAAPAAADSAVANNAAAAIKKDSPQPAAQPLAADDQRAKKAARKAGRPEAAAPETARREIPPAIAAAPAFDSPREGNLAAAEIAYQPQAKSVRMTALPANARLLRGKVLNTNSQSLAGVAVTVDKTRQKTYTDSQGNFALVVDSTRANNLELSAAGYAPGVLNVKREDRNVHITLQPSASAASAVVITAGNAQPENGLARYRQYIDSHLRYPVAARQQEITGVVRISFDVIADSTLSDLKVAQKLHPDCDAEALRLIREGPKWLPAPGGKTAQVTISIPFNP